ncbi:hypothetical protein HaLaN_15280, partial [Haematococcus lacustris]
MLRCIPFGMRAGRFARNTHIVSKKYSAGRQLAWMPSHQLLAAATTRVRNDTHRVRGAYDVEICVVGGCLVGAELGSTHHCGTARFSCQHRQQQQCGQQTLFSTRYTRLLCCPRRPVAAVPEPLLPHPLPSGQ